MKWLKAPINLFNKIFRPRYMSQEELEAKVDSFQERYGVPESELGDMFKNKDPKKWKK